MVLTVIGHERIALGIFAGVAAILFPYVLLSSLSSAPRTYRGAA
jgi:hypothetical protein